MLNGIFTAACLIGFICVVIWAYSSKQKKRFDEASKLPLIDEDDFIEVKGPKS